MKKIGVSQRVDYIQSYGERRDSLDQKWTNLLLDVGLYPIPLPNLKADLVEDFMSVLNLDGILLTGGNSLSHLDVNNCSNAPERDVFEKALVEKSMAIHLPLLGVCRGMQLLNHQFDGQCSKVQNHAGTTHPLKSLTYDLEFPSEVNSFHHWGIAMEELASDLIPLAVDTHGYVEAMKHREANIYGIMWHPERDKTFQSENIELLKAIFL